MIPPASWRSCTSNISGTPSATPGTAVTGGAANTDGTTQSCIAAITHDVEFIEIGITGGVNAATNTSSLVDIFVDPAGGTAWETNPRIADLLGGYSSAVGISSLLAIGPFHRKYSFPLFIKAGSSIGARLRSPTASLAQRIAINAYGGNSRPESFWCGQRVESVGIATPGSSLGQTHTPGNTGTFSAWTNLGSVLSAPCGALQFAVSGGGITNMNALFYHFEFGVGSQRIGPPLHVVTSGSEAIKVENPGPIFCNLPDGAQLQVRATCSGTGQQFDVAAYAVQ
jgi:hypothetical protein